MKNRDLLIYRVVTVLFSSLILFQVFAYFLMYDMTSTMFESLGVPTSIIYPLAIAKFLGLVAIWTNRSRILKELAYLGYAVDFMLAVYFHIIADDGGAAAPAVALAILVISYIYNRKVYGRKKMSAEIA